MKVKLILAIVLLVFPILTLLFVYPWLQLWIWANGHTWDMGATMTMTLIAIIIAPFTIHVVMHSIIPWRSVVVQALGAGMIMVLAIIIIGLTSLFIDLLPQPKALLSLLLGGGLIGWSIYNAVCLRVITHTLPIKALKTPLRVAHLSDIHLGSRSAKILKNLVALTNAQNVDVVVISGDLVDTSLVNESDLAALGDFNAPVLLSSGNHDHYVHYEKVMQWVRSQGVTVLDNAAVELLGIQFIGLEDCDHPAQALPHLARLNPQLPAVLLYHRPDIWPETSPHNIALTLSGHTHNGQIFPFNLLVRLQYRHIAGLYQQDDRYLNVSQGCGTWGPTMRLGTRSEIVILELVSFGSN